MRGDALAAGQNGVRTQQPLRRACFPLDSFISLITQVDEQADIEVGRVGSEGMLGVAPVLGIAEAFDHRPRRCRGVHGRFASELRWLTRLPPSNRS